MFPLRGSTKMFPLRGFLKDLPLMKLPQLVSAVDLS